MMRLRVTDTETCGIEAPNLQIVQIAAVDLVSAGDGAKGESWALDALRSWYVNPGRLIPCEAMAVHHTTDKMVEYEPPIATILPLVFDGAANAYAAHNAAYDMKVVEAAEASINARLAWVCTYKAAVTLWPDSPSHKNQVLRYWLGLNLKRELPPHTAIGDAIVTAHIAQRILAELSLADWIELSTRPVLLPQVHFGEHANKMWADVPWSYLDWILHKSKGPWDEDIFFTAKHWYAIKNKASRSRGPQLDRGPY